PPPPSLSTLSLHDALPIFAKQDAKAPHETLLVVDATTGSNALAQAREFHQAIGLTGLIVTKIDGSGKGGIVIAIQDELGLPTRLDRKSTRLNSSHVAISYA